MKAYSETDDLGGRLEKLLNAADGFPREWLSSLVYTPLFGRPVVLEMMREWVGQVLNERSMKPSDFVMYLDRIVANQLTRLLSKREMPSIIHKEMAEEGYRAPFGDHPLVGHVAIYSLNLILLRILLVPEPFVFVEKGFGVYEDGARPWDRLTHLWRSWFSLENLKGLTAVLEARREGETITIQAKPKFQMAEGGDRLETLHSVSVAIGDDVLAGLSGLAQLERSSSGPTQLADVQARLSSEHLNADVQVAILRLRWWAERVSPEDVAEFCAFGGEVLRTLVERDRPNHDLEAFGTAFRNGALRGWRRSGIGPDPSDVLGPVMSPARILFRVLEKSPTTALMLVRTAREIAGPDFWARSDPEFVDRLMHEPRGMMEPGRMGPSAMLAWAEVLGELYNPLGDRWRGRPRGPRMFHRMFNPGYFMELSENSPEAAVAWLRVLRNLGAADRMGRELDPELMPRLLDPDFIGRLCDRSPGSVVAWIEILQEFPSLRLMARRMGPDLRQRQVDGGLLRFLGQSQPEAAIRWMLLIGDIWGREALWESLSEQALEPLMESDAILHVWNRSPDTVVEWVGLLSDSPFREQILGRLGPEVAERLLDTRFLLDLADRRPGAALMWIGVIQRWWSVRDDRPRPGPSLQSLLEPGFLVSLSERSPEAAVQCLRTAGRLLRGRGRIPMDSLEPLLDPKFLVELSRKSPRAFLEWAEVMRDLGSEAPGRGPRGRANWARVLDGQVLAELAERSPEALVSLVRLLAFEDSGGGRSVWHRLSPDLVELLRRPRFLLQMAEKAPDVALLVLDQVIPQGAPVDVEWRNEVVATLGAWFEERRPRDRSAVAAVALRMARMSESAAVGEAALRACLAFSRNAREVVAALPLASLGDLRWTVEAMGADDFRSGVEQAMASVVPGT